MTFTESIQTCFKKYTDFAGCASRSEYWWWTLFMVLVSLVLEFTSPVLSVLFALGTFIPGFAVTFRRLHDTDRSAWWLLIALVPVVGSIVLLVFFVQPGKSDSRYAVPPEAVAV